MIRSRTPRLVVAVALSAALMAGCTGSGSDRAGRGPAPGSRVGGTITVATGPVGSVDPLDAYEPNGLMVARTMCDTLVEIDPRSGAIRPGLAASWTISDHGSQLSFRIRKGARFSDGRRVTSADVVYSLSRAASPAFAGRAADLLEPIVGWPEMRGQAKSRDPRTRRKLIGVQAITGDTVRVLLRRSQADAIVLFTHPVTAPVSKRATEAASDQASVLPVCSGPYRLTRPWSPSEGRIALVRTSDYKGSSAVRTRAGAGYADRIDVVSSATPPPGSGPVVDVVFAPAASGPPPGMARVSGSAPGAELIGLPQGQSSPFRLPEVRRALSLALDRTQLAERTGGGHRVVAAGFIPPNLGGIYRVRACGDRLAAHADKAAAAAALARAHVDLRATRLPLIVNEDGSNRAVAEEVASQWRDVLGLAVDVKPVAFTDLVSGAASGGGLAGPFRLSWAAAYPSADAHLAPLFASGSSNEANLGRWNDPVLDRILNRQARRSGDAGDRRLAYRQMEDRLCATLPALPLTWARAVADVNRTRVSAPSGRYLDASTGLLDLRQIWAG